MADRWDRFTSTGSEHWATYCHGNGLSDGGYLCKGYAHSDWPCDKCCEQNRIHNSAGFVETEDLLNMETDNFPVTLIAYRGERTIPVLHVRMDSISVHESKVSGYVDILFEIYGTDITGTIPMVDYYTTESDVS